MAKRLSKPSIRKRTAGVTNSRSRGSSKDGKRPKDAVTLIVLLKARDGQERLLEAELRALVGPTRREEGCIAYDLHDGAETPGAYLLHEVWASRGHHHKHTQTDHFIRWNERKDALIASREVTYWRRLL